MIARHPWRHVTRTTVAWFVTYWTVFFISLCINDRHKVWNGANLTSRLPELIELWGWSDAGSYLNLGSALAESGQVPPDLSWIVVLWPIGMPFIYRIAIELSTVGVPILLSLQLITGIVWFACLSSTRALFLRWSNNSTVAHLSLIFFILSPLFRRTLLGSLSIYSDSLTLAFLVLWLTLVLKSVTPAFEECSEARFSAKSVLTLISLAIASGIFLALAALTRSQYRLVAEMVRVTLLFALVLAAASVATFAYLHFKRIEYRPSFPRTSSATNSPTEIMNSTLLTTRLSVIHRQRYLAKYKMFLVLVLALTVVFATFSIVISRYYDWREDLLGDVSWSENGVRQLSNSPDFAWRSNWRYEDELAGFIRIGGQGYACKAEPQICALLHEIEITSGDPFNPYTNTPVASSDYRKFTIAAIVSAPSKWLAEKGAVYSRYARMNHAPFEGGVSTSTTRSQSDLGASLIICSLAACQIWSYSRRRNKLAYFFLGFFGAGTLLAAAIGPSFVAHFEVRYLLVQFFFEHLLKSVAFASVTLCLVRRMRAVSEDRSLLPKNQIHPKVGA